MTIKTCISKWLLLIKPDINISAENDEAFREACSYGHTDIAKWLLLIKPDIDISVENDEAFREACLNGYTDVAKWFIELNPQKYVVEIINGKITSFQINKTLSLLSEIINLNEIKECAICYIEQSNIITNCNHEFCHRCINLWYTVNKNCPYCRTLLTNCNKISLQ